MVKYTVFLYNQQVRDLKRFAKTSSVSEKIRQAINEYLEKLKREELNVSTSSSKKNEA